MKKKTKKFNIAAAKRKLDRLFSKYILARDNRECQKCHKTACKVDCSHIIPRQILVTRWLPENAVTLCVGCHKYGTNSWHSNPLLAVRWLDEHLGVSASNQLIHLSRQEFVFNKETYAKCLQEITSKIESLPKI